MDTLVSNASSAVGAGDTLSGIVPNFIKGADGLTDAFQIADAVKQATTNSIKETASIKESNASEKTNTSNSKEGSIKETGSIKESSAFRPDQVPGGTTYSARIHAD